LKTQIDRKAGSVPGLLQIYKQPAPDFNGLSVLKCYTCTHDMGSKPADARAALATPKKLTLIFFESSVRDPLPVTSRQAAKTNGQSPYWPCYLAGLAFTNFISVSGFKDCCICFSAGQVFQSFLACQSVLFIYVAMNNGSNNNSNNQEKICTISPKK
jgi:hypothetical protein